MRDRSREAIERHYADLLGEDGKADILPLIEQLDAACTASNPDPWLPSPGKMINAVAALQREPPSRRAPPLRPLLLTLAVLIITAGVVMAASGILNLGKPTSDLPTNQYFPLSGFRRMSHPLRVGSRVEVLVITTNEFWPTDEFERWPVVKVLEQFGTLTNTRPEDTSTFSVKFRGKEYPQPPTLATIDWSTARYRSRYVAFVHKDTQRYDPNTKTIKPFQKLTSGENRLLQKYSKVGGQYVMGGPLVVINDYAQYSSQTLFETDFRAPPPQPATPGSIPETPGGVPLSFATIQSALETGKDPPQTNLVEDTNAEANVMIALICHGDAGKPASVCGRPAIKRLLKHVK